ncbi:hypothetical protein KTO58_24960 [Chitinophaga pendula]|uniref:hypothetical protein n=1 Tax=Chitinophaga TaxID=79328 RepID=UPI0012FD97E7|nr:MULTISPECIES: hypothetical protein [Chitinophaga]UCJ06878.1 hypothetical protein KTO58_24960 [Chitinophaga pendula]
MRKIALAAVAIGAILVILAQYAITNDWMWFKVFHTLGFAGYIFIISAAAYFSLEFIHRMSRDERVRMRRYVPKEREENV